MEKHEPLIKINLYAVTRTLVIPKYRQNVIDAEAKSGEINRPFQYIVYAKVGADGYTGMASSL